MHYELEKFGGLAGMSMATVIGSVRSKFNVK